MNTGFTNPFARKFARQRSDFYVNKVIDDELHMARVRDVSASGLFLYKLLEPLSAAQEVGLEMVLPGKQDVIWAAGRVIREEERDGVTGVAVQFTRISNQHRQQIAEWVEATRNKKYEQVLQLATA